MKHQTQSETTPVPTPSYSSNSDSIDTATLELLASWRRQDFTDNPEEVRAAEQELTEFKRAMNQNRTLAGDPLLYP